MQLKDIKRNCVKSKRIKMWKKSLISNGESYDDDNDDDDKANKVASNRKKKNKALSIIWSMKVARCSLSVVCCAFCRKVIAVPASNCFYKEFLNTILYYIGAVTSGLKRNQNPKPKTENRKPKRKPTVSWPTARRPIEQTTRARVSIRYLARM